MSKSIYLCCIFLVLSAQGPNRSDASCASFTTDGETVSAVENTTATLSFSVNITCKENNAVDNIKIQQKNDEPPHPVICSIDLSNGKCAASPGCTCDSQPQTYSVSRHIEGPQSQEWELVGQLQDGEKFRTVVLVIVSPTRTDSTQATEGVTLTATTDDPVATDPGNSVFESSTQGNGSVVITPFGFMLLGIIGCIFLMVLVVAILVGVLFKRRSRTESLPPPPAPHVFRHPPMMDAVMFHAQAAGQDHRESFVSVQGHIYHEISDDSDLSTPILSEVYFDSSSFSDDTGPDDYLSPVASETETATTSRTDPPTAGSEISQSAISNRETTEAQELPTVAPEKEPPYENIVRML